MTDQQIHPTVIAATLSTRRYRDGKPMRHGWRVGWPELLLVVAGVLGFRLVLQPAQPARDAPLAPDFTLPLASSAHGALALHALRGHVVLVNFLNSQCPSCITELPILQQTAQRYRTQGVEVLGVATGGDTLATVRQFIRAHNLTYAMVVDTNQAVAWRYMVQGWPTSFFVDARGRLRGQYIGPLDAQTVRAGLAQAGALRCERCDQLPAPSLDATPASTRVALDADAIFAPPRPAPAFAFRDQQGRLITPRTLRGRVVALTFVSAVCTADCPLIGFALAQVDHGLGWDRARLSIVAISVDPEQDSPAAIQSFAARAGWYGADWHYLTAPRALLAPIWSRYGIFAGPPPPPGQDPAHTPGLFLLDPQGRERAYYDVPFLTPRVVASIRALLAASGS